MTPDEIRDICEQLTEPLISPRAQCIRVLAALKEHYSRNPSQETQEEGLVGEVVDTIEKILADSYPLTDAYFKHLSLDTLLVVLRIQKAPGEKLATYTKQFKELTIAIVSGESIKKERAQAPSNKYLLRNYFTTYCKHISYLCKQRDEWINSIIGRHAKDLSTLIRAYISETEKENVDSATITAVDALQAIGGISDNKFIPLENNETLDQYHVYLENVKIKAEKRKDRASVRYDALKTIYTPGKWLIDDCSNNDFSYYVQHYWQEVNACITESSRDSFVSHAAGIVRCGEELTAVAAKRGLVNEEYGCETTVYNIMNIALAWGVETLNKKNIREELNRLHNKLQTPVTEAVTDAALASSSSSSVQLPLAEQVGKLCTEIANFGEAYARSLLAISPETIQATTNSFCQRMDAICAAEVASSKGELLPKSANIARIVQAINDSMVPLICHRHAYAKVRALVEYAKTLGADSHDFEALALAFPNFNVVERQDTYILFDRALAEAEKLQCAVVTDKNINQYCETVRKFYEKEDNPDLLHQYVWLFERLRPAILDIFDRVDPEGEKQNIGDRYHSINCKARELIERRIRRIDADIRDIGGKLKNDIDSSYDNYSTNYRVQLRGLYKQFLNIYQRKNAPYEKAQETCVANSSNQLEKLKDAINGRFWIEAEKEYYDCIAVVVRPYDKANKDSLSDLYQICSQELETLLPVVAQAEGNITTKVMEHYAQAIAARGTYNLGVRAVATIDILRSFRSFFEKEHNLTLLALCTETMLTIIDREPELGLKFGVELQEETNLRNIAVLSRKAAPLDASTKRIAADADAVTIQAYCHQIEQFFDGDKYPQNSPLKTLFSAIYQKLQSIAKHAEENKHYQIACDVMKVLDKVTDKVSDQVVDGEKIGDTRKVVKREKIRLEGVTKNSSSSPSPSEPSLATEVTGAAAASSLPMTTAASKDNSASSASASSSAPPKGKKKGAGSNVAIASMAATISLPSSSASSSPDATSPDRELVEHLRAELIVVQDELKQSNQQCTAQQREFERQRDQQHSEITTLKDEIRALQQKLSTQESDNSQLQHTTQQLTGQVQHLDSAAKKQQQDTVAYQRQLTEQKNLLQGAKQLADIQAEKIRAMQRVQDEDKQRLSEQEIQRRAEAVELQKAKQYIEEQGQKLREMLSAEQRHKQEIGCHELQHNVDARNLQQAKQDIAKRDQQLQEMQRVHTALEIQRRNEVALLEANANTQAAKNRQAMQVQQSAYDKMLHDCVVLHQQQSAAQQVQYSAALQSQQVQIQNLTSQNSRLTSQLGQSQEQEQQWRSLVEQQREQQKAKIQQLPSHQRPVSLNDPSQEIKQLFKEIWMLKKQLKNGETPDTSNPYSLLEMLRSDREAIKKLLPQSTQPQQAAAASAGR